MALPDHHTPHQPHSIRTGRASRSGAAVPSVPRRSRRSRRVAAAIVPLTVAAVIGAGGSPAYATGSGDKHRGSSHSASSDKHPHTRPSHQSSNSHKAGNSKHAHKGRGAHDRAQGSSAARRGHTDQGASDQRHADTRRHSGRPDQRSGARSSGRGDRGGAPGNNGTIKVAEAADSTRSPNNDPHVTCAFQIEWFGFDDQTFEGDQVVSDVTFTGQSPTRDSAPQVVVGSDQVPLHPADADSRHGRNLNATETYQLSFAGAPHPRQGYHVKVTTHTESSNGSTKKSKVFWVEDCSELDGTTTEGQQNSATPGTSDNSASTDGSTGGSTGGSNDDVAVANDDQSVSFQVTPQVLGTQATLDDSTRSQAGGTTPPTSVDAGVVAADEPTELSLTSGSSGPLLLLTLAGALGALGVAGRRRIAAALPSLRRK